MKNPFRFGTIVDDEYFTDREKEVKYICQFIQSTNHLILISPRRFGKSSVVAKALRKSDRENITINLQQVTSISDLASKILREFFKLHPIERVRHLITHFRIIPTLTTNALTGSIDVAFQPGVDGAVLLEDAMTLIENAYTDNDRLVVVFDEFQEILSLDRHLDKQLRAIMQNQRHINYILLGSQESMMTEIFEQKKSPFYHFGQLMRLGKLPRDDFHKYLIDRLSSCCPQHCNDIADQILDYTDCHPYYTQQLAASVWQIATFEQEQTNIIAKAVNNIVEAHGLDYERLWITFNRTNKWIMQRLATKLPLQTGEQRTSTIYSALKRMQKEGYVIFSDHYEIEDPFFREWIAKGI